MFSREKQYIEMIKDLQKQLYEKNKFIEEILLQYKQLAQDNIDNNTATLKLMEQIVKDKITEVSND